MWWKLRPPVVDFVALEGQVLTVCSPVPLQGEQPRVRIRQAGRTVSSRILPSAVRQVPAGFVYTGLVMRNLTRLKPGFSASDGDWVRRSERIPLRARLRCRQIPGFHANTVDLNATGVLLCANRPLEVGQLLEVELETPHRTLPLRARVAWSGRLQVDGCRMGLEFLGETAELQALYDQLKLDREHEARLRWMQSSAPWPAL